MDRAQRQSHDDPDGKDGDAREALAIGLVDAAFQPEEWREQRDRFIEDAKHRGLKRRGGHRPWKVRVLEAIPVVRNVILGATKKRIAKRIKHYPALGAAVRAIADGLRSKSDGYQRNATSLHRCWLRPPAGVC